MPIVSDASALVAALLDGGADGAWAASELRNGFAAPTLLPYEVANIIRRHELAGLVDPGQAVQAHADLVAMPATYWPFEALAGRAWELRANLSAYDASYVALAELLAADLITLDRRLARAPGPRCPIRTPDELRR
jgi:predicted nucleic acid-binding protein